jgi:hypothetical protein
MSDCRNNTAVPACFVPANPATAPEGIVIHYVYDVDGVNFATVYTTADGTPIDVAAYLGGGVVTPGACPAIRVDVEHELLCDDADADPSTPAVSFFRRYERFYNSNTGVLINQVVTDLALDLTTTYSVSSPANVSSNCAADFEYDEEILCDATGATVVRRTNQTNGVQVTLGWFNLDGTVAAPTFPVGACPNCAPETPLGVITAWAALR